MPLPAPMDVDLFDFDLPDDRIALRPVVPREAARLLLVRPGEPVGLIDQTVANLPDWLRPGDVLVRNDTRVIPARLHGIRRLGEGGARVEVLLHRRLDAARWVGFARPAKKLKPGDRVAFGARGAVAGSGAACAAVRLDATVVSRGDGGEVELGFDLAGPCLDEAIAALGELPLPPYIAQRRPVDAADQRDYQTVYAQAPGAVAAPTAGLHLTEAMFATLADRGVSVETLTLHVGAGTFLPVKAQTTAEHRMHGEWGEITPEVAHRLNAARAAGARIVAVGTTSLRLLESAVDAGGQIAPFSGETDIFITPGHRFRAVDVLMTNFHLPRSTLFMLVSAFCGLEVMQSAYAHAIASGYRFYSYGDASLLFRAGR